MERESEMMKVRWHNFKFHAQVPRAEQRNLKPCSRCFATLVLAHSQNAYPLIAHRK